MIIRVRERDTKLLDSKAKKKGKEEEAVEWKQEIGMAFWLQEIRS